MNDDEIVKVIRTLVGKVIPIADSNYDEKIKYNIEKLGNVISCLIADIGYMSCESFDSPYASEEECGKLGYRILKNTRNDIDEYLSEIEVVENDD